MNSGKDVIVTMTIDPDLAGYDTFFDGAWAEALTNRAPVQLSDAVGNLILSWRMAADTHRIPFLMIDQMENFAESFMRRSKPDMAVLMERFRSWLFKELDGKLQRVEKKAISAALSKLDQGLRLQSQVKDARFPAMEYWADISGKKALTFSIAGSQNLAYCALFFAYDWFLAGCFRALGGEEELQTNGKKFWKRFKELLGRDPEPDYWEEPEDAVSRPIAAAKLARHSIAHTGALAKKKLREKPHGLRISKEGFISVWPENNWTLFKLLQGKVDRLVDEIAAKLAATT
jgi:hypothetical protein